MTHLSAHLEREPIQDVEQGRGTLEGEISFGATLYTA